MNKQPKAVFLARPYTLYSTIDPAVLVLHHISSHFNKQVFCAVQSKFCYFKIQTAISLQNLMHRMNISEAFNSCVVLYRPFLHLFVIYIWLKGGK